MLNPTFLVLAIAQNGWMVLYVLYGQKVIIPCQKESEDSEEVIINFDVLIWDSPQVHGSKSDIANSSIIWKVHLFFLQNISYLSDCQRLNCQGKATHLHCRET